MQHYDYLIVGTGLFGAVFAYKAKQQGKKCLVIDRRPHLGGNIYRENIPPDLVAMTIIFSCCPINNEK
jgi:UDP-galactopyranose mutase